MHGFVKGWVVGEHLACNCLILLTAADMIDRGAGMQKGRLQLKQCTYEGETSPTLFIRATNGHVRLGLYCLESLFEQVVHGCPCLFGDSRIQLGLRADAQVRVYVSMKRMMLNCIKI